MGSSIGSVGVDRWFRPKDRMDVVMNDRQPRGPDQRCRYCCEDRNHHQHRRKLKMKAPFRHTRERTIRFHFSNGWLTFHPRIITTKAAELNRFTEATSRRPNHGMDGWPVLPETNDDAIVAKIEGRYSEVVQSEQEYVLFPDQAENRTLEWRVY
jgi:hypothetical protein